MNRRQLTLLWVGAFTFFFSFLLLLGALPIYMRRLDTSPVAIGLVTGAFGITSLLLRPVVGWGADRYGRRPLMIMGATVFAVASVAYDWAGSAIGLGLVRLLHGCGMGLYPTAASAMVADLSPPGRRGEILGFYGAAGSVALAMGPVAGIAIAERGGFAVLFWTAGVMAALSAAITLAVRETLTRPRSVPFTLTAAVSRAALLPGLLALCLTFSYGAQIAFLPLHAESLGVNPGVFFLVFAVALTIVRGPAGRLSDRIGRPHVACAGLSCAAAAMVLLALGEGAWALAGAGVVYGLAYGAAQPALIAWSVDSVPEGERGRAVGTYHTAFELGIVIGATASGLLIARWGNAGTFLGTAVVAGAGRHRAGAKRVALDTAARPRPPRFLTSP